MRNVYFDLTREFNRPHPVVALASGQAVVYYRLAIMSKDGDWVIRVLAAHGARYRPAAPLDVRWLRGGWSSHFEHTDDVGRRIRCDFVSRPARVSFESIEVLFAGAEDDLIVVDRESLIRLKQTARAKDYAAIGELARELPPAREIELTTDVDRIIELAASLGAASSRTSVRAARAGAERSAVVAALAQEIDALQQLDRRRVAAYQTAAAPYLAEFRRLALDALPLDQAHEEACRIAEALLPDTVSGE